MNASHRHLLELSRCSSPSIRLLAPRLTSESQWLRSPLVFHEDSRYPACGSSTPRSSAPNCWRKVRSAYCRPSTGAAGPLAGNGPAVLSLSRPKVSAAADLSEFAETSLKLRSLGLRLNPGAASRYSLGVANASGVASQNSPGLA